MGKENDIVLKKLKRNFIGHMICNTVIGGFVLYELFTNGFWPFPLIMLGVSFIATGVTCGCIAKRLEQYE